MALTKQEQKQLRKNAIYWETRGADAQAAITDDSIAAAEKQLIRYYSNAQEKIIGHFVTTYNHLRSTVSEGREPTPADLYKLDTYWKMEAQVRAELEKLGDKQATFLGEHFTQQYIDIYNGIPLPSQDAYSTIDTKVANQIINQVWAADCQNWSNRIWTNTEKLQEELNENLVDCVINGRKPTELKHLLVERFGVSYSRANTLVRTELAHIQTQAAAQRYKDAGVTEVEVWASKDERRCKVCAELHQKRYPIFGHIPVPAHPRCRCCILPVVE